MQAKATSAPIRDSKMCSFKSAARPLAKHRKTTSHSPSITQYFSITQLFPGTVTTGTEFDHGRDCRRIRSQ